MAQWDEASVAAELLACEAERRDREPFTDEWPDLDVETGYRIQDANMQKRLARRAAGRVLVRVRGTTPSSRAKNADLLEWSDGAGVREAVATSALVVTKLTRGPG
jgi:hypothetical protein